MKRYCRSIPFLVLLSFCTHFSNAQQRFVYTDYLNNPFLLNPALTGSNDYTHITGGIRVQPKDYTDHIPLSYYARANSSVGRRCRKPHPVRNKYAAYHSLGGIIYNDETAPLGRTGILGSYAFSMRIKGDWRLSGGVFMGGWKYNSLGNKYYYSLTTDTTQPDNTVMPDASFGLNLRDRHFYFGAVVQQLIKRNLSTPIPMSSNGERKEDQLNPYYFFLTRCKA